MAKEIESFAAGRRIEYLLHFTRMTSLDSILRQGLITRDRLSNRGGCNDALRLDGTNAVCASIGFPNYQMFYKFRQDNPGVEWVIMVMSAYVLWRTRAAFCACNAASNVVTALPIAERMTAQAFRAMYSDFGDIRRANLGIPDNLPTHPQAEVLLLDGAPREAILGVAVNSDDAKQRITDGYPGLEVQKIAGLFSPRKDYLHWKKVIA